MRKQLASFALSTVLAAACLTSVNAADWPQFRGPNRDNISKETGLLRSWPATGPKVLWTIPVEQGYAGAAIVNGRVYHHDYDAKTFEWKVYCRNLADGKEIWSYSEKRRIRPNHGITRTVPAVDGEFVYSFDPKCILHCLKADTGEEVWRKSLVTDYKSKIPPWYNGQNPLMEKDRIIIATGGEAILVALEKATGKEIWRTPNPNGILLSHASVMPATLDGVKQYLYGNLAGLLGVSAADGKLLWQHERKFNVALSPSPLAVDNEKVFLTGPYDAGSIMIRVKNAGGKFSTEEVFNMANNEWNSEVHTPIVHKGNFYAVGKKRRGLFTCMGMDGKPVWDSNGKAAFGLGSFLLADNLFFILEGRTGMLRLADASASEYKELASAQVLSGHDVWGPMALSDGKLVLRDMTKMVCLDVSGK